MQNFLSLVQNTKVDQAGLHFFRVYQMCLKQKQIICLVTLGQSITVKTVVVITGISLMMDRNQLEKDTVIMVYV